MMIYSNKIGSNGHTISGGSGTGLTNAATLTDLGTPFYANAKAGMLAHTDVSTLPIKGDIWSTNLNEFNAVGVGGALLDISYYITRTVRADGSILYWLNVRPLFPVLQGDVAFRWGNKFNVRLENVCIFKNLLGFSPQRMEELVPDYFDKIELSSILSMNYNKNVTFVNVVGKNDKYAIFAAQLKTAPGYVIDYDIRQAGIFATVQFVTDRLSTMLPMDDDGRILID